MTTEGTSGETIGASGAASSTVLVPQAATMAKGEKINANFNAREIIDIAPRLISIRALVCQGERRRATHPKNQY